MNGNKFRKGAFFEIKSSDGSKKAHCKIIIPEIKSEDVFVNGCSLVYIYPEKRTDNMSVIFHTLAALASMKIIYLKEKIPRVLKYIGTEPVFEQELNLDVGIKSGSRGEWIEPPQIQAYEKDHLIVKTEKGYIAVPFYDVNNERLDHIPEIQLEEGYTTVSGLIKAVDECQGGFSP